MTDEILRRKIAEIKQFLTKQAGEENAEDCSEHTAPVASRSVQRIVRSDYPTCTDLSC